MPGPTGCGGGIVTAGAAPPDQRAEMLLRERGGLGQRHVADEHERGAARLPLRLVKAAQIVASDGPDRAGQTARRPAVRMIQAEGEHERHAIGDRRGIVRLLSQAIERQLLLAIELGLPGTTAAARRRRAPPSPATRFRFRTSRPSRALSRPAPHVMEVPRSPSVVSISSALFAFVPRRITRAVRLARPPLPAGSLTLPLRDATDTDTFGSSGRSTTNISTPLSSFADFTSGAVNGRSAPSGGSFVRSTAPSTAGPTARA